MLVWYWWSGGMFVCQVRRRRRRTACICRCKLQVKSGGKLAATPGCHARRVECFKLHPHYASRCQSASTGPPYSGFRCMPEACKRTSQDQHQERHATSDPCQCIVSGHLIEETSCCFVPYSKTLPRGILSRAKLSYYALFKSTYNLAEA